MWANQCHPTASRDLPVTLYSACIVDNQHGHRDEGPSVSFVDRRHRVVLDPSRSRPHPSIAAIAKPSACEPSARPVVPMDDDR